MLEDEAIFLLATHSGHLDGPRLEDGIVAMLRPYRGVIERNLHEVIECLFVLHKSLQSETIRTLVPLAVVKILSKIRDRAIEPAGMLRRNELIADADISKLLVWIQIIETVTIRYMSGLSHSIALSPYVEYLLSQGESQPISRGLLTAAISDTLLRSDEYRVDGIRLATKYPDVGIGFRDSIGSINRAEAEPELLSAIDSFQASIG